MTISFGATLIAAMVGVVLYQIISGRVINRNWKVWVTREEQPGLYWVLIGLQVIIVSIPVALLLYGHFFK